MSRSCTVDGCECVPHARGLCSSHYNKILRLGELHLYSLNVKTTCAHGHKYTPENTYIIPSTGARLCRSCQKKHADSRSALSYRQANLLHRFGLTLQQFDAILHLQDGKCANPKCNSTEPGGNSQWHVDHDRSCCPGKRSCGKCVRGLLCHGCNTGTGLADSIEKMLGKIEYLRLHENKIRETS